MSITRFIGRYQELLARLSFPFDGLPRLSLGARRRRILLATHGRSDCGAQAVLRRWSSFSNSMHMYKNEAASMTLAPMVSRVP